MKRFSFAVRSTITSCRYLLSRTLFLLYVILSDSAFSTELSWPNVALPDDIQAFSTGENVSFNGIPVRLQGFVSNRPPDQLAQWFHQKMGEPLMDDRIGNKRVLGRLQDDAYITIEIEAQAKGSRGLVAVTLMSEIPKNQKKNEELNQYWLSKMPPGSRLLQQVLSQDGKRYSVHLTFSNTYSAGVNRDAVLRALKNEAYELEDGPATKSASVNSGSQQALYFNGKNKQAIALVKRVETGSSIVVLNLITSLEQIK